LLFSYLTIESPNKAPSSFIQFKAIEILLHLHNVNGELFSMIEIDFSKSYMKVIQKAPSPNFQEVWNIAKTSGLKH